MLKVPINEILPYADSCYISVSCTRNFFVYGGEESNTDRFMAKKEAIS